MFEKYGVSCTNEISPEYIRGFDTPEEAAEWLHTEEYDSRTRYLFDNLDEMAEEFPQFADEIDNIAEALDAYPEQPLR